MESGNEYYSEVDDTLEELLLRLVKKPLDISYITLDHEKKIMINAAKVSEVLIED